MQDHRGANDIRTRVVQDMMRCAIRCWHLRGRWTYKFKLFSSTENEWLVSVFWTRCIWRCGRCVILSLYLHVM